MKLLFLLLIPFHAFAAGKIIDADISATAAIQRSKFATGTAYAWCTNNASGEMTSTAVTANRAVATDANGQPVASSTTATELGYVAGVTSAIQTQLNAKFTLPALTGGSALFSDGSTIAQDNSYFYYNSGTHHLSLGSTAATGRLDLTNAEDSLVGNLVLWGQGRGANSEWLLYDSPSGVLTWYNPNQANYGLSMSYSGQMGAGAVAFGHPDAIFAVRANAGQTTWPTLVSVAQISQTADLYEALASDGATVLSKIDISGKGFFAGLRNTALGAGILRSNASGDQSAAEISGDCTTSGSNAITCTKTNGTNFGTLATKTTSGTSILKGDGSGGVANATSGTDYAPATSGAAILYGNGAGGFSNVTVGSGLTFSAGTLSASGGGGGTTRFVIEGAVVPYISINGPHYQSGTQSLTTVYLTCLNSGSSGSTVFQVNQYRSGSLQGSATASLSASSSAPASNAASLSGTLSLAAGDVVSVDINSGAAGASDCSLEY